MVGSRARVLLDEGNESKKGCGCVLGYERLVELYVLFNIHPPIFPVPNPTLCI